MKTAVYGATRRLYADVIPAIKSLIYHSDVEQIYLMIEDDEFPYWLPDCVECINVWNQRYFRWDGPNYTNGWTYMVLMKAALHRLLLDPGPILMLDVDTIVKKDISGIWDYFPLDGYWLAAAVEPTKSVITHSMYINAGVMLMNLQKLREDGKGDELIEALNTKHYPFCEQDCIAELCQGGIKKLPSDYNVCRYTEPPFKEKIIHFAAVPNWQEQPLIATYRDLPWDAVLKNRI